MRLHLAYAAVAIAFAVAHEAPADEAVVDEFGRLLQSRARIAWNLVRARLPAATPSRSPSASAQPSISASATPSPSTSVGAAASASRTVRPSPSVSASPTRSPLISATPSRSPVWPTPSPSAFPSLVAAPASGSFTFQNGWNGYWGQVEMGITTTYIDSWNEYNGISFPAAQRGTIGIGYYGGSESRALLRFDNLGRFLSLPAGSVITAATLTLTFRTYVTGVTLRGAYFAPGNASAWNADDCCVPSGFHCDQCNRANSQTVGWAYRAATRQAWAAPGGLNNTLGNTDVVLGNFTWLPTANDALISREIALDPAVVNSWINTTGSNNGMIWHMAGAPAAATVPGSSVSASVGLVSGVYDRLGQYRPALRITWAPSASAPAFPPRPLRYTDQPRMWYVDWNNGNDDMGAGMIDRPYRSAAKAMEMVAPGDTVVLRGGVHPGGFSIYRPRITLTSYPGEKAVISSPLSPTVGIVVQVRDTGAGAVLRNLEIKGGYYYGVLLDTSFDYGGNFVRGVWSSSAARGVLIEDVVIHHVGTTGIRLKPGCTDAVIRRTHIYATGHRVRTYGHCIDAINAPNLLVEDSICTDSASSGYLAAAGTSNATFRRNYIARTNLLGIGLGWYSDDDQTDAAFNPLRYQCLDCRAENNVIVETGGAAIGMYAALRPVVAHNTLWAAAMRMQTPLLLAPVQQWISATRQPIVPVVDPVIYNNVVAKDALARKGPHLQIRSLADCCNNSNTVPGPGLAGSLRMGGNVYYDARESSADVGAFQWGRGVMLEDERAGSAWVGYLPQWRTRMGTDLGSVEADPSLQAGTFLPAPVCGLVGVALPADVAPVTDDHNRNARVPGTAIVPGAIIAAATPQQQPMLPRRSPAVLAMAPYDETSMAPMPTMQVVWPMTCGSFVVSCTGTWETYMPRVIVVDAVNGADACAASSSAPAAPGCGTVNAPFRTLAFALSRVWPGDTIQLRGNAPHAGCVALYMANVTLESFPGEWAVIDAPTNDPNCGSALRIVPWGNIWMEGSDITIRRLEIRGGYYYAIFNNQVPARGSFWRRYLQYRGLTPRGFNLIEDVYAHHSGTSVIKLSPGADGMVFRRVEIAWSGVRGQPPSPWQVSSSSGGSATPAEGMDPTKGQSGDVGGLNTGSGYGLENRNGADMVLEDSYIHDIRGAGVLMGGGARNALVHRNLVANVDGIGIIAGSFNTEIQWQDVASNPSHHESIGATIVNNVVTGASGAGIGIYSARDGYIAHNTLVDVAGTSQAAVLWNLSPQLRSPTEEVFPPNINVTVANNVVVQARSSPGLMMEMRVWQGTVQPAAMAAPANATPAGALPSVCPPPGNRAPVLSLGAELGPAAPRNPDGSCPVFPPSHPLNQRVDTMPLHPMSDTWIQSIGVSPGCARPGIPRNCGFLHPDFGGSITLPTGPTVLAGIPFAVATSSDPLVNVTYTEYPDESDPQGGSGLWRIPPNAPIEGSIPGCDAVRCGGDRHLLVLYPETCMLAEFWRASPIGAGNVTYTAANGAVWNLTSARFPSRPLGWTSADAAGMPIYPALVRYAEVAAGEIRHAIRMTVTNPQRAYVAGLATHYAGYTSDPARPPMGLRLRLRANYTCGALAYEAAVICVAMQRYGLVIADGGSDWFISGEANAAWNVTALNDLRRIPGSAFEAVDSGRLCYTGDCRPLVTPTPLPIWPAVRNTNGGDVRSAGNVYFRAKPSFMPRVPGVFVDRNPVRPFRGNLTQWAAVSGLEVGSVDGDPMLHARHLAPIAGSASAVFATTAVPVPPALANLLAVDALGRPRDANAPTVGAFAVLPAGTPFPGSPLPGGTGGFGPAYGGRFRATPFALLAMPCDGVAPSNPLAVYVNRATGNDGNCDPTAATPLRTIAAAMLRAGPGSTVYLAGGTYTESAIVSARITLTSMPGQRASIQMTTLVDRSEALTILPSASGAVVRDLDVVGGYTAAVAIRGVVNASLIGLVVRGSGEVAVWVEASRAITIASCEIVNAGQRTPRLGDGILLVSCLDVLVTDCTIRGCRSSGVHITKGSRVVTVQRNVIANGGRGISLGSDHPQSRLVDPINYDPDDSDTCTWYDAVTDPACHLVRDVDVVNNVVQDTEDSGIIIAAANNTRVAHNTLMRTAKGAGACIELWAAQKWVSPATQPVAQVDGLVLANNLVAQTNDSAMPAIALRRVITWQDTTVPALGRGIVMRGNAYLRLADAFYAGAASAGALARGSVPQPLSFTRTWYQRSTAAPGAASGASLATIGGGLPFAFDGTPAPMQPASVAGSSILPIASYWTAYEGGSAPTPATTNSHPIFDDNLAPLATSPYLSAGVSVAPLVAAALTPVASVLVPGGFIFAAAVLSEDAWNQPRSAATVGALVVPTSAAVRASRMPPQGASPARASSLASWEAPLAGCAQGPQRWCRGDNNCWVPGWHATTPASWSEATVFATCFNGGGMFPRGSEWSRPVTGLPRHARSDDWITNIGPGKSVWAAFGSLYDGRPNGFIVTYVAGAAVPRQRVRFLYSAESDNVVNGYPLLPDMPGEDSLCDSNGDRHVLVVDKDACVSYELFKTSIKSPEEVNVTADGFGYLADSGAVFNLRSPATGATGARPAPATLGWTSSDAAGLSVTAGLVFWHEVNVVGEIRHAIRFTIAKSSAGYIFPPATHYASSNPDPALAPMGARFRLNPTYNCTAQLTSRTARVICVALQQYGMIVADNGGDGGMSGQSHPLWDDAGLSELRRITLANFEAVETGAVLCTTPSCSNALTNAPPVQTPF